MAVLSHGKPVLLTLKKGTGHHVIPSLTGTLNEPRLTLLTLFRNTCTRQLNYTLIKWCKVFYPNLVRDVIGSIWITLHPLVSQSVSQSHTVSAITWAVLSPGSPNSVQRCPRVISRSSLKMLYVDLFLDVKDRFTKSACLIYRSLSDIICNGPPQGIRTDSQQN